MRRRRRVQFYFNKLKQKLSIGRVHLKYRLRRHSSNAPLCLVLVLLTCLVFVVLADPDFLKDMIGPFGHRGQPVYISERDLTPGGKERYKEGWKTHNFNQYTSDLISVHRSLLDMRHPHCRNVTYPRDLPQTSVVIVFHNQAWSVLLRCVHSVLDRSPPHLLKEVVLVDENSTLKKLKFPLDNYFKYMDNVKIVRVPWEKNIAKSRSAGFRRTTADVITFLDSSVEVTEGWLEPLLERIWSDDRNVAVPMVEGIDEDTFKYLPMNTSRADEMVEIVSFDWDLVTTSYPAHTWMRVNDIKSVYTPVLTGSMFAINRDLFSELDDKVAGMDTLSGWKLEFSFRAWMCGGFLEVVPCSHVGKIVEKEPAVFSINQKMDLIRVAKLWLGEYIERFYNQYPNSLQLVWTSGLERMIQAKDKIFCTPFRDYLASLPTFLLPRDWVTPQSIISKANDRCIGEEGKNSRQILAVVLCGSPENGVGWRFDRSGRIHRSDQCFDYNPYLRSSVMLNRCLKKRASQEWIFRDDSRIFHKESKKCLEISADFSMINMGSCEIDNIRQEWDWAIRFGA